MKGNWEIVGKSSSTMAGSKPRLLANGIGEGIGNVMLAKSGNRCLNEIFLSDLIN